MNIFISQRHGLAQAIARSLRYRLLQAAVAATACWALPAIAAPKGIAGPVELASRLDSGPLQTVAAAEGIAGPARAAEPVANSGPVLKLGSGDAVSVQVFGRPELTTTTYVSEDGTISVPLAGSVQVAGMAPAVAAQRVAAALRKGQYLVDPQVTIFLVQFRSQQVSVLGEVRSPARFPIESKTTVFDLLAQAGGITENGSNVVYLLRPGKDGQIERTPIDFKGLAGGGMAIPTVALQGGDAVFVPRADQFYIYGEVQSPNMYRLDPGMTVIQAIARSGGITARGSDHRIEIRRRDADGSYVTISPELTDPVQANDVLRVKERIF